MTVVNQNQVSINPAASVLWLLYSDVFVLGSAGQMVPALLYITGDAPASKEVLGIITMTWKFLLMCVLVYMIDHPSFLG